MENVALFLVREVTHFNGDLVPEFCAAVFNEYTQLLNAQCIQGTTTEEQEEFVKFVSNCTSKCRSACKNIRVSVAMHLYRSADNFFQFLVAFGVFGYEALKLYEEGKKRKIAGNTESVCEASIEFTPITLSFCALCGLLGGTVGGLLGSGGGFILGPLLLEIGVIPQVASATATFVMLFSSSLSVVEFYFLHRFPFTFALYLMSVSLMAGFWGQYFVRKLVAFLKRASLIVFILSGVIFASALTMGVIGIEKSIQMINDHEFMGFLDFCSNQ